MDKPCTTSVASSSIVTRSPGLTESTAGLYANWLAWMWNILSTGVVLTGMGRNRTRSDRLASTAQRHTILHLLDDSRITLHLIRSRHIGRAILGVGLVDVRLDFRYSLTLLEQAHRVLSDVHTDGAAQSVRVINDLAISFNI